MRGIKAEILKIFIANYPIMISVQTISRATGRMHNTINRELAELRESYKIKSDYIPGTMCKEHRLANKTEWKRVKNKLNKGTKQRKT